MCRKGRAGAPTVEQVHRRFAQRKPRARAEGGASARTMQRSIRLSLSRALAPFPPPSPRILLLPTPS